MPACSWVLCVDHIAIKALASFVAIGLAPSRGSLCWLYCMCVLLLLCMLICQIELLAYGTDWMDANNFIYNTP